MTPQNKVKEWIDIYLQHIQEVTADTHVRDEEGYKFKSVDTFQKHFNIDTANLSQNLEEAIENNNLVTGNMYFPRRVLLTLAAEYEEETRAILKNLFDTNVNIVQRINAAESAFSQLVERRNQESEEEWKLSFINLRFLSLLLGFRHPNTYNAIKPREWTLFCKYISEDFRIPKRTSSGEKYMLLEPYIEVLRGELNKIPGIQELKDQLTRGLEFSDDEFRWMAQDVIYVTARVIAGQKGEEGLQQESNIIQERPSKITRGSEIGSLEFPLEEYLENFIIRNWSSIDFGEPLTLYIDDEGTPAQQYPTSEGFIDLLAKDINGNFVVIELKKGRSNQQVVGQILGYVGWVKRNLAEDGQEVRGIIIASSGNGALMDAVSTVSAFISVKYYRIKFNFEDPNTK